MVALWVNSADPLGAEMTPAEAPQHAFPPLNKSEPLTNLFTMEKVGVTQEANRVQGLRVQAR